MNGVLIIDKPQDFTSFDVTAKLRGMLHTKKIGHGGTLDPKATGVLPVFTGSATKLCDFLQCEEKTYEAEITFGIGTDTEDIWGNPTEHSGIIPSEDEVRNAICSFKGDYDQIPPMYSAKKINGKKLYELARKGEVIERQPVRVKITNIEILSIDIPRCTFRVSCTKGTYIRTLCSDIGRKLGTCACMSALRRTQHGQFGIENAVTLEELQTACDAGEAEKYLIPLEKLFSELRVLKCRPDTDSALMNGNQLKNNMLSLSPENTADGERFAAYTSDGKFRAVYAYREEMRIYAPLKMFIA